MNSISNFGNNIILKHMFDNISVQNKSVDLILMTIKRDTPKY